MKQPPPVPMATHDQQQQPQQFAPNGSFLMASGTNGRRRAASNYHTMVDPELSSHRSSALTTSHGVFELLQKKFGFQVGNMLNQKEHLACWIANQESRMTSLGDPEEVMRRIHARFFRNYVKWCKFLQTPPFLLQQRPPGTAEKQLALYLLIWGESANLRFMPECLCFLYHNLASKLEDLEKQRDVPEGTFLLRTVRPIYNVVANMKMAAAASSGQTRALDHKNITNYDDMNEFFWSPSCLDFDECNVAEAMSFQELKTFKERRSIFTPFLAFFRIYFFLIVSFHVLGAIAYTAYRSDPSLTTGLHFYNNFFSSEVTKLRNHAFYSVFITVSGLLAFKVLLEVWVGGIRIFTNIFYAGAMFARVCWHAVFFGLFVIINLAPNEPLGSSDYLSLGLPVVVIYIAPVVIIGMLQMCGKSLVWQNSLMNSLDGRREQFIGRNTSQPWGDFLKYAVFWSLLLVAKLLFSLQFMVKPLMGPSVEIYDLAVPQKDIGNGILQSNHNIAFIVAMWAPVFLVYMYDTQIWLALFQSIVGMVIGIRLRIGHSFRISEFVTRLQEAPGLFDSKVVSELARNTISIDRGDQAADASGRLRFAVVWNEIVSSFRLNDLLDDRETAILQYQISDNGIVEDPVFLVAGHAQRAIELVLKNKGKRRDDLHFRQTLTRAGVWTCAMNCIDIGFQIMRQLLGKQDSEIGEVLDALVQSPKVCSLVNLQHLPLVCENLVELLASILDLPEPIVTPGGTAGLGSTSYNLQHDEVVVVVQRVDALLKSFELMLEEEWMAEKVRHSVFARMTSDLEYQKSQIMSIFAESGRDSNDKAANSNDNVISLSTRLFFLLTLDAADSLPRCHEARRRMSFFLNSLNMKMPSIQSIGSMNSFSVITPYYNESVLFSVDELNGRVDSNPLFRKVEQKDRDLSILKYLVTFHNDEWGNFLERVGASSMDEALAETPTQVRLWASMRGQTLARTVHGMMMYEDALKMLRWLEIGSDQSISHLDKIKQMDRIAGLKFSYVTSCQLYSEQLAMCDKRAADIDLLMRKYPNWRVSYFDKVNVPGSSTPRYDCVLVKSDGDEIVEVYRYELPGHPVIGEGKPENQNIALPFTRGEYVQTIDMNQEHYFEEALKIPNFLATATENGQDVTIIGMKEHIFTGRASSLARFMTQQELVFVSLTQRVLANPQQSRCHYGHPDVFEKSFVMTCGGVSKASKGINLSEDVFAGYNATLRGGKVIHVEFMQCGKGRDVTLSQINAFEAKLSNGSAESSLSREANRMGGSLDFFRLNSIYYGHMGFYICNALTVLCVYVYAYSKLYIALHYQTQREAITKTKGLDDLAEVLNTQFIFQFGMLMTIPLIATLFVEMGWRQAILQVLELFVTLGPMFYIFETGTKSHFYDVAIMRGGSKYRGTGRGFAIVRETLVNFFKEYTVSHFRKAVELVFLMIMFGIYGNFRIGVGALQACNSTSCESDPSTTLLQSYGSKGQDYGVASFAVWLLGACWILSPFFFNTDGFDFAKTRVDVIDWVKWMIRPVSSEEYEEMDNHARNNLATKPDSWQVWWLYEASLLEGMSPSARIGYAIRALRHPLCMYYVYTFQFDLSDFVLLGGAVGAAAIALWLSAIAVQLLGFQGKMLLVRGAVYSVVAVGGLLAVPLIYGAAQDWTVNKSSCLMFGILLGLKSLLELTMVFHGVFGLAVAKLGLVRELGFLFDFIVGLFLVIPLLLLSALPFMRTIQTRMMYNEGFSRALSTGSEFAASLSVMMGLLTGITYGWLTCLVFSLGFVNNPNDQFKNLSFNFFVNTILDKDFPTESLKVFAALASIVGVVVAIGSGHALGRRFAIGISCIFAIGGACLVFYEDKFVITLAICIAAAGAAMLSVSCMLYNFEICTRDWKGKGVLMFLFGTTLGYLIEAALMDKMNGTTMAQDWKNNPLHDWQWHFIYGVIPLVLVIPATFFLPESPVWLFRRRDGKAVEAVLVRLRQKHDVGDEVEELKQMFSVAHHRVNIWFRFLIALLLQGAFAVFMSNALLLRVKVKSYYNSPGQETSKWMVYFGAMNFCGVALSTLTIDNVRRKTILKDVMPFLAAISITCGALMLASIQNDTIVQILLWILFIGGALSLTCTCWLSAIEMFPPYHHSLCVAGSFSFYYLVQAGIFFATPGFAVAHFVFAGLCAIVAIVLFTMCASSPYGAIELKSEKARRKKEEEATEENNLYMTRASRSCSMLRSRRSSSHFSNRTPHEGNYEHFESPAAHPTKHYSGFQRTVSDQSKRSHMPPKMPME